MRRFGKALWSLPLAALLATSIPAMAQPGGPPPGQEKKDKLEAKKKELEEKKQRLEEKKDALAEKKDALAEKKDALAEKKEGLEEKKEGLDPKKMTPEERKKELEARQARREERRKELRAKWGDVAKLKSGKEELRVHARRMARLNRVREVAEAEGKTAVVERADKLIKKEQERHDRAMERIKSAGEPK